MRMLNRIRNAVVAAADIEARAIPARATIAKRRFVMPLTVLVIAAAGSGIALPARANSAPTGSTSVGNPISGSMSGGGHIASGSISGQRQFGASRSILSMPRPRFGQDRFEGREVLDRAHGLRRFHHRERDFFFADGFFPFGFWPGFQPDLVANVGTNPDEGTDWRSLAFWAALDRYQPPTVEKSPSGVTIIRGPGSHHGFSAP